MTSWTTHERRIPGLSGGLCRESGDFSMPSTKALRIVERTRIEGATLAKLRQASKDLRAVTPDSALAELVDAKIESLEVTLSRFHLIAQRARPIGTPSSM